jgi:ABC-type xylose transport system permease subunit
VEIGLTIDSVMLPLVELVLVAVAVFAAWKDRAYRKRAASVKREPGSVGYLYEGYVGVTAILIWLPLIVESAEGFRVPLVLLNVAIPFYLLFFNAWFRNQSLGWVRRVTREVER